MSAVINPRPCSSASSAPTSVFGETQRPTLITKIEGQTAKVNAVVLLRRDDGLISASEDRSIRIWLKRDSGQYWPSVCHYMEASVTALDYCEQTSRMFVGLASGMIHEFSIADDFNSIQPTRQARAHTNIINCIRFSLPCELVFSCGKDKMLVWHCSETGDRIGSHQLDAWLTALQIDSASKYAFVGDYSGNIAILHVVGTGARLVSKLSAHTGTIRSLAWDQQRQLLFSGSSDNLVIMWDIGGKKGQAYELNGHASRIACLGYAAGKRRLFSADENGSLVCWDMSAQRIETPAWKSEDACQLCESPFFWNFRAMWNKKVVGLRQHHCRLCGQAVCASCCDHWTKYPPMGYELPIRVCDTCHRDMQTNPDRYDLTPLSVSIELRQGVACMDLDETKGRLLTIGYDRMLMLWDVKPFV